jgi:hypothetical protein
VAPKDNAILNKPALPDRYRSIAEPLGIVGAIEIECSPLLEDKWVLDVTAKDGRVPQDLAFCRDTLVTPGPAKLPTKKKSQSRE